MDSWEEWADEEDAVVSNLVKKGRGEDEGTEDDGWDNASENVPIAAQEWQLR